MRNIGIVLGGDAVTPRVGVGYMQMSKGQEEGSFLAEVVPPGLVSAIWFEAQSPDSLLRRAAFGVPGILFMETKAVC